MDMFSDYNRSNDSLFSDEPERAAVAPSLAQGDLISFAPEEEIREHEPVATCSQVRPVPKPRPRPRPRSRTSRADSPWSPMYIEPSGRVTVGPSQNIGAKIGTKVDMGVSPIREIREGYGEHVHSSDATGAQREKAKSIPFWDEGVKVQSEGTVGSTRPEYNQWQSASAKDSGQELEETSGWRPYNCSNQGNVGNGERLSKLGLGTVYAWFLLKKMSG